MQFVQAKNFTPANRTSIRLIVIHDMEYPEKPTGAEWCADFFAGRNGMTAPKASAHYAVDNDSIVQCVRDEDVAWHAPGANADGIGIEHAGYANQTRAEWLDDYGVAELQLSSQLVAELCAKHDIPPVRISAAEMKAGAVGILGHADVTLASGKPGHTDPGPNFPWDWYLERVRAHYDLLRSTPEVLAGGVAPEDWPIVVVEGVRYAVAPQYIWPVGIGQAEDIAKAAGCELPSKALVDAIWAAADLKIDAAKMVKNDHDGTPRTMASLETFNERARVLESQVRGRPFRLLAGYAKDVIRHEGKIGLYGWQNADGSVIQPFFSGHARGWIDYSQGLRCCRRLS